MKDKMSSFLRSITSIKKSSQSSKDPEFTFAVTWTHHLVEVLTKHRNDREFTIDVLMSASEYYKREFDDQQKADIFCLLLGMVTNKKSGK